MSDSILLVCGGKVEAMNENQFVACMMMLNTVQKGAAVPSELPPAYEELLGGGGKKSRSKKTSPKAARDVDESDDEGEEDEEDEDEEEEDETWVLDKQTHSRLRKMFRKISEDEDVISNADALKEFKRSGVDEQGIRRVMKLVPRGQKGAVSEGQFIAVMFLLKQVRGGAELPSTLPASLKKIL